MKRNFKLLVAVAVLVAMVLTLASCDVLQDVLDKLNPEQPQPHEHQFSADWSKDETNHWHAATCQDGEECTTAISDLAAHTYVDGACSVCGAADPNYVPECTEHQYGVEVTKEATCTEAGEKKFTCGKCGYSYTQEIAPSGHSEVVVEGTAPTCTETGLSAGKKCSVCGTVTKEQQTINASGHTYVEGVCHCGAVDPEYNGPKTYTFDCTTDLDSYDNGSDNVALAEGTTFGDGYFTIVGVVKVRVGKTSKEAYAVDVDKDEKGGIQFIVKGEATVTIVASSTGDGNKSLLNIIDANGNYVLEESEIVENSTDKKVTLTYTLKAGTYKVVSSITDDDTYNRGVRIHGISVVDAPVEAPEIPSIIKVTTNNSYGYNDMAEPAVVDSFTAPVAGFYSFKLPAGLGLWSKASAEENPWGNPEVSFMDNSMGTVYTVELAEGEIFEFYVGAMSEEEWIIEVSYSTEKPAEPTVIDLYTGDNAFTVQEIDLTNGVTAYLFAMENASYTFSGTGIYINVYNAWGMLIGRGFETVTVDLESYCEYVVVLGADTVGEYSVNVSYVAPIYLEDGENSLTVGAEGANCVYYAIYNGDFFFNVTGATVVVYDSFGDALTANEDGSYTLESYTQYSVVVTADTEGEYTLDVVAPVYLSQYEDNTVSVGANGVVVFLETSDRGHYTVSGEGLTVVVTDAEGNVYAPGALLPGYSVFIVTITAETAGSYDVTVTFEAPVGSYDNPDVIESLPATLTPDLPSDYANYYYEFTATANGHVTLTYNVVSGLIGGVSLDNVDAEDNTVTVAVIKGMTYTVYFSSETTCEVSATLTFEAGEITEAEWKEIITYSTLDFANGSSLSLTYDWMTEEYLVFFYQYDEDWNFVFKAYYSYTVTENEDGSLTLKLTYVADHENNEGTAPAIGDLKVALAYGEWTVSCVHTTTGEPTCSAGVNCTICGEEVKPALEHEYFYACDAHCMNCHELTNEEAAHTLTHVEAKAATCTEDGNIEYWACSDCGTAWDNAECTGMPYNRFTVIVPAGHADANEDGVCPNCDSIITTLGVLKALYALENNATLGTYTLTGVITSVQDAYSSQYKNITVIIVVDGYTDYPVVCYRVKGDGADKIGKGDTITVTGTLVNYNGTKEFTTPCTIDSYTLHECSMEEKVVAPTCTAGGYTTITCVLCDKTEKTDEKPATGHTTENGVCDNCGEEISGDVTLVEKSYAYTMASGNLKNNTAVTLGGKQWTLAMTGSTYLGWDSNDGRGIQIGKKAEPVTNATITSENFDNVSKIVVNASGASGVNCKLVVKVGDTVIGSYSLTTTATDYTFEVDGTVSGPIVIEFQNSGKGIYIKSISVNYAEAE